jgi:hypothetical protein
LTRRIRHREGEFGSDVIIHFSGIRHTILILSSDPKSILFVGFKTDNIVMKATNKAADLVPVSGGNVVTVNNVIGNGRASVVGWRSP